ncbi:hypothetical protein Tco_0922664 [Tanacetum coccineum]|uniref:Synaptobrevin, longin-like domain protein n=1 Tax=Tanacetum coccineum TaxID=301880 RepID=A0ABQ5CZZ2_9ASTR
MRVSPRRLSECCFFIVTLSEEHRSRVVVDFCHKISTQDLTPKFWETASTRTLDNGEVEITTTIDEKVKIVTEASIRRHLKLEDSDGITSLPTTEIFEQLSLMGSKKTSWEQFSSNIATAIICLATNKRFNFSKLIFDGMGLVVQGEGSTIPETEVPQPSSPPHTNVADEAASTGVDVRHGGAAITVTSLDAGQGSGNIDKTPTMPHNSSLLRVNTLGSDEGRMQQNELMDLVTKLSDRVVALETDLQQTKKVYGAAFIKLIKKVKRLEKKDKLSKSRRKLRLVLSDEKGSDSDILAPKQGKKIDEIDQDPNISLVQHDTEFNFDFNAAKEVSTAEENVSTAEPVSTTGAAVTTASVAISTATPTRVSTVNDIASESLVYIRRSATKIKDTRKTIMEESESTMTKTKRQQEQERLGLETAVRLQEEFDEEMKVEADEELAQRLQAEEKEKYTEVEQERLLIELINQRKRYFAKQRAEEKRNKSPTQAQQRTYMSNYIKNMGNYTLKQLRSYSFDEIKTLFETTIRDVQLLFQ